MIGKQVAHYRILEKLGEGGMGVVWKARDTALARMVAIKVLPEKFASDQERTARFRREAHALASLSHPNIAAVYGLEEAEGRKFLVMELAEGETLARKIARGRIPWRETLEIARQVAEGVEEAHDKGILHRDLKPANVMISVEGKVKILDFGLAKIFSEEAPVPVETQMPTLTASVSHPGVILGTVAYMSPEQARGRPVGRRADIWAFGCLLFEMLTGERAFQGETITDTLAKVLEGQPRWELLPQEAPSRLRELLESCLRLDPQDRLHDIGDARLEIRKILAGTGPETTEEPRRPFPRRTAVIAGVALAVGVAAGGASVALLIAPRKNAGIVQAEIDLEKAPWIAFEGRASLIGKDSPLVDISPDGTVIVYVGEVARGTQLFLRRLDSPEVKPVAGTLGAIHPFFSPDGKSIGFLTNESVRTVPLGGGEPVTLTRAKDAVVGTWAADRFIYFTEAEGKTLVRVPIEGGQATQLFKPRLEYEHGRVLPSGKHVLSVYRPRGLSADHAEIRLIDIGNGSEKTLVANGYGGRYAAPNKLVFGRGGDLYAVDFDPDRTTVSGKPRRVASNVCMDAIFGQVHAGVSGNGIVAYMPGGDAARGVPAWVDRAGNSEFTNLEERIYGALSLSKDGQRLAIQVADVNDYLVILDLASGRRRTIKGLAGLGWPLMSPKGDGVVYAARKAESGYELLYKRLDVEGPPILLGQSNERMEPTTWSGDGKVGGYEWPSAKLFVVSFAPEGGPGKAVGLQFKGEYPVFSPDGQWMATRSPGGELIIRALDGDRSYQITSESALEPLWCAQTGELFYRQGNRWFATKVRFAPSVEWEKPRQAFETEFINTPGISYALSPDGQRLLVVKRVREIPRNKIHVILNSAEVKGE